MNTEPERKEGDNLWKLYELYLGRRQKEHDIKLTVLKIYITLNTFASALVIILIKAYIDSQNNNFTKISFLGCAITLLGFLISLSWILQCLDSRRWATILNKVLSKIEDKIIPEEELRFYNKVCKEYDPKKSIKEKYNSILDALDINICTAVIFTSFWIFLFLFFVKKCCTST